MRAGLRAGRRAAFAGVEILVNAAGVTVRKRAEEVAGRRVAAHPRRERHRRVRLLSGRRGGDGAARGRRHRQSVLGARPFGAPFGQAEYSASKGAVDALTRSLAAQWAEFGMRVNAVAPTFVETDLTRAVLADEKFAATLRASIPMGRWADAGDVVGPVLFLASPAPPSSPARSSSSTGGWSRRVECSAFQRLPLSMRDPEPFGQPPRSLGAVARNARHPIGGSVPHPSGSNPILMPVHHKGGLDPRIRLRCTLSCRTQFR